MLFLQLVSIVETVAFTVLRMLDCVLEDGVVTLYPLGSLLLFVPEKPKILLKPVKVNGAI